MACEEIPDIDSSHHPTVDLWVASLAHSTSDILLLSSNELARADRFRSDPLREFYIFCRSASRQILSSYVDVPAERLVFDYGSNGKPFLPDYPNVHFNTSHSRGPQGLLVCAVSLHFDIGVDVEQLRPFADMQLIARHFFAPAEQARLADLPPAFQRSRLLRVLDPKRSRYQSHRRGR